MTVEKPFPAKGKRINWVFCLDSEKNKNYLLASLIKLKLETQHSKGIIIDYSKFLFANKNNSTRLNSDFSKKQLFQSHSQSQSNYNFGIRKNLNSSFLLNSKLNKTLISNKQNSNQFSNESSDGYWVIKKDWTECTLKCDGGKQFQHLLCIASKGNGKPCEGEPVLVRPCNLRPCPKEISQDFFLSNSTVEFFDFASLLGNFKNLGNDKIKREVVFKYIPISNKPIQFDKCHLKESDALWLSDELNNDYYTNSPKIPTRLVMNENAISLYTDEVTNY